MGSVILRVADMGRAVAFWSETVGLSAVHTAPEFSFLDGGSIQLVLSLKEGGVSDESLTEVVFAVDDVETAYVELEGRGVPFEVELRPITGDGERVLMGAHFRDPDGHYASLTGWVDES